MRLAPVALAYAARPERASEMAAESSRTTHGARTCLDACRYLAGLIVGALQGRPKEELLQPRFARPGGARPAPPLDPLVDAVAGGSFLRHEPPAIRGSGFVARSLEAALWAFSRGADFEDGAQLAVNLGDDADTTGAVYGQLAGAFHGLSGILRRWRERVAPVDDFVAYADRLQELAAALWGLRWGSDGEGATGRAARVTAAWHAPP